MAKALIYSLLAAAMVVFLVFPHSGRRPHKPTAVNRRLGTAFPIPTFDPLVVKMEQHPETSDDHRFLDKTSFPGDVSGENQYFSEEGKLNITLRLVVLFPLLDRAPKDDAVNLEELRSWLTRQAVERLIHRTRKELDSHDRNGDGAIEFGEYLPQFSEQDIAKNGTEHGEAGWWQQQFINADADQNGILNSNEFHDFLHPEDSNNSRIQTWLSRENIKRMDHDGDEKLSFEEFQGQAYDTFQNYFEFENEEADAPSAKQKFAELDLDKNEFLDAEELKPILGYLQPGEVTYAKYYASYLIREVDENGDGEITLEEMLNHEYIFYNTVYKGRNEEERGGTRRTSMTSTMSFEPRILFVDLSFEGRRNGNDKD